MTLKSAKDLRGASYNPRQITNKQLDALGSSISSFGDLSTVVFNRRTKTLIAGHQRTKTLAKWPSKIVTKPHKDQYGTVEQGFIIYKTDRGELRVPIRVVDWPLKKEKQANIAANMHGGDFDRQKLAALVAELETDKNFDIELLGMDAHDLTMLHKLLPKEDLDASDDTEEPGEFESALDKVEAARSKMVCCPKCKFKFEP